MSRDKEDHPKPSHPPPPCDPFQRYQHPWPRNERDDENPFIRFRRYADEQFRAMFRNTWPQRPRPFATPPQKELEQISEDDGMDLTDRMGRTTIDLADRVQLVMSLIDSDNERTHDTMRHNVRENATATTDTSRKQQEPNTELDVYNAMPVALPAMTVVAGSDGMPQLPHSPNRSIDTLDPFVSEEDFWPYMAASPYSPLRVDLDTSADWNKDSWRSGSMEATQDRLRLLHAFDDLFRLAHSREMLRGGGSTHVLSSDSSGHTDKASVALSREHPEIRQNGELENEDVGANRVSETDSAAVLRGTPLASTLGQFVREVEGIADGVARAFLGSFGESTQPRLNDHLTHNNSSVVSTMTRTETRTLPDGSVETRRVLKRRFADGNEEHEESVDTSKPSREVPDWLRTHLAAARYPTVDKQTQTQIKNETRNSDTGGDPSEPQIEEMPRSGGWFWR